MKAGHSLSLGSECQRGGGWETGVEEGKRERMLMVETKQPLQQTTEKKRTILACRCRQLGRKERKEREKGGIAVFRNPSLSYVVGQHFPRTQYNNEHLPKC